MNAITKIYLRLREQKGDAMEEYGILVGVVAVAISIAAGILIVGHFSSMMRSVGQRPLL
jgi:Flp pilus assembly pilin Flp